MSRESPKDSQLGSSRSGCRLALGLGCAISLVAALLAALVVAVVALVFVFIRQSDPIPETLDWARAQAPLRDRLGEPIEAGWLIQGSVRIENATGSASLRVPLEGPRGKGILQLEAELVGNLWRFRDLDFEPDDGSPAIDLGPCPSDLRPCPLPVTLER